MTFLKHYLFGLLLLFTGLQAHGASLDPNGRGQVLLFPFVTAENGWDTFIGLDLNRNGGHIVRLRFMDPNNGAELHTFNVYSAPGENWRAAITAVAGGWALRIAEGSCTIADTGQFGGPGTDFPLDSGVGMLEAYSVSEIFKDFSAVLSINDPPEINSCSELAARLQSSSIDERLQGGFLDTQEMSGYFDLVNVGQGLAASQPAVAIREFSESLEHTPPSSTTPNLTSADPVAILNDGTEFIPASGAGIDAIAKLLSPVPHLSSDGELVNNVVTVKGIAARTDWILTFPLRGYAPARDANALVNGDERYCEPGEAFKEQEDPYVQISTDWFWRISGGGVEGQESIRGFLTPFALAEPMACNAINAIAFGDAPGIFLEDGSEYQYRVRKVAEVTLEDGSYTLGYDITNEWEKAGETFSPVLGFRVTTFINGRVEVPSDNSEPAFALANYMTIRPHDVQ